MCVNHNKNKFYAYTNNKLTNKSFVPPLKTHSGVFAVSDIAKAEQLNATFQSIFTIDNGIKIQFQQPNNVNTMSNIDISASDILSSLAKLPTKVSRTPDGIWHTCIIFEANWSMHLGCTLVFV